MTLWLMSRLGFMQEVAYGIQLQLRETLLQIAVNLHKLEDQQMLLTSCHRRANCRDWVYHDIVDLHLVDHYFNEQRIEVALSCGINRFWSANMMS